MKLKTKLCSSLTKVMPDAEPEISTSKGTALRGERFSFQMAYNLVEGVREMLEIKVESLFGKHLRMRKVGLVPVEYTGFEFDDDLISRNPGLYPDVLSDFNDDEPWAPALPSWRSIWFTVDIPSNFKPGTYEIKISYRTFWAFDEKQEYHCQGSRTFTLEVLDAVIPPQTLKNTHWFHTDCLASYYNVPVFSEEHWKIIGNFMVSAAAHGINMLLTPVFTPPLDTQINAERPTVQLVDVELDKGRYSFNFDKLDRWITMALKAGIQYFEISHLFTQWGGYCTPKIMAAVNGKEKRIFGWDVKADSKKYRDFLDAFLPRLADYFKEHKLEEKVYFHCSDEPYQDHLESYKKDKAMLDKHLRGFKIMDALSHVDFYKQGIVTTPIPVESKLKEFLAAGMEEHWTYYCCGPTTVYSNRFIHMPSSRNRIFGVQLYVHEIEGFLHWGFNFYYSGLSRHLVNPYQCNDSGHFFPAGDAFLVYPGPAGEPEDSIRYEVFYEALQDQRVLQKLESLTGREQVMKALNKLSPTGSMSIDEYPKGEKAVLAVRTKINQLLKKALEK